MEHATVCISCKKNVMNETGTVKFFCPSCGKSQIVRCRHCREIAAQFKCPSCGFTGPN